jgi:endonuclease YncB( thermonuclease family)
MKKIALSLILALALSAPAWSQDDQAASNLAERLDNLSKALDVTLGALEGVIDTALNEASAKAGETADKALEATADALLKASEALNQAKDDLKRSRKSEFEATVIRVTDGDTIVVRTSDAEDIKIRLYGIDSPESKQDGGDDATKALMSLQGQTVKVIEMDTDRYSRTVALIEREGKSVNLEQVKQGHAWYYPQYCKEQPICGEIEAAEKEAKETKRGLWDKGWFWGKKEEPVAPWEWRKKQREPQK